MDDARLREFSSAVAAQRESLDAIAQGDTAADELTNQLILRLEDLRVDRLKDSVKLLSASVRRQQKYARAIREEQRDASKSTIAEVMAQLARVVSGRRVIVGPWCGDVGHELLYWVPFVRWCMSRFQLKSERLHVVSRAGAPWYGDVAAEYTDLLRPGADGEASPLSGSDISDAQAAREIVDRLLPEPVEGDALLHPGLMHQMFRPYWEHQLSTQDVVRCLTPARPVALTAPEGLPDRYVAVRCAFGPAFPETPANRAWLDELLAFLTKSNRVVWLGGGAPGVDGADQREYVPPANDRVHRLDERLRVETSLATQAAVIAGASAYVGTYGGLCYVASYYGVPAVGFQSSSGILPRHRRVAEHVFGVRNGRSLLVVDIRATPPLQSLVNRSPAAAIV